MVKIRSNVNFQITERDKKFMCWVNCFGFVTAELGAKWFGFDKRTFYRRMRKLRATNYLKHSEGVFKKPGHFTVTNKGIEEALSNLPPPIKISETTYYHDVKTMELSMKLCCHYNATFISERMLIKENLAKGFKRKEMHIADGVLVLEDKQVAIEVELTRKSRYRYRKIFSYYLKQPRFREVWYFCRNQSIQQVLKGYTREIDHIKIFLLDAALNHKSQTEETA